MKERGWLFLRHSAWLSLILSLLQAGLWKVSLRKIPVSREDTFWIEQTSKDTSLLTLCEQYEECQVLTVNSRDEITDRLAIELALQGAYIRQIAKPSSVISLRDGNSIYIYMLLELQLP